ncbi:methyl-CpG-binding domain protein 1b [Cyprinodon tularosa]|uniref:methyl-CpG-binding domain protein 1b n=1 Tax=Cyprinodon tularosa TaxID=77115 RepID=UPI0018E28F1A|nr:methyl-CpG-binding domain protein 1b [Cyprinodon tularosa]
MSEEAVPSRLPVSEPVERDQGENTEENLKTDNTSEELPAPSDGPKDATGECLDAAGNTPAETKDEAKAAGEPPMDWFEPLEDDDDDDDNVNSPGRNYPDEESLIGETESVAGSERTSRRVNVTQGYRRKRAHPDEGWIDWPSLGQGWKRKEVVRRSGSSIGQVDVYYLSPRGDRVRSRVELTTVLHGTDLTNFEYKTGKFYDGEVPPPRSRGRIKKKFRERSSSESSWMERGDGAETPDSHHRLTPSFIHKNITSNQKSVYLNSFTADFKQSPSSEEKLPEEKIRLPFPSSSRPLSLPSIKGEFGSEESTLLCAKCGISFTGTWYDKQRKRPCCPTCWATSKSIQHPLIRFRKWIPCGQCVGCHNSIDCGQCANCKHGLQSPDARKRLCRKRRCICPIRKNVPGSTGVTYKRPFGDTVDTYEDSNDVTESQHPSLKSSDTENFSVNVDLDDDDMSTDDDEDWHKKRKRRSCGECKACLCRKDCGVCDFCIDKPKFGGSNKKRQKCRLRQCQRQAMRHLLPFQMGAGEYGPDGPWMPGRPRPHYTYSRKTGLKRNSDQPADMDFTDYDDDDDSNSQPPNWGLEHSRQIQQSLDADVRNYQSMQLFHQSNYSDFGVKNGVADRFPHISNHNYSQPDHHSQWDTEKSPRGVSNHLEEEEEEEEEELPMITQIYSLAENPAEKGIDLENQLMKLLHSLRSSVLPILWYAIVAEGPQLQLIQCSKQSTMADTIVLINPGFYYQVTVQKQPLLPTHPLYDTHPSRLSTATDVVSLLLSLERYVVCQGLPPKESVLNKGLIILERAATCDFLVKKNERICSSCKALQGPQTQHTD